MTSFLYLLALVALCSGRLLSLPVLQSDVKSAPLLPVDVILALLVGAYILRCLIQHRIPFLHAPHSSFILAFVVWSCVSLLVNMAYYGLQVGEMIFSSLYLVRWIEYSLFFYIGYDLVSSHRQARKIVTVSFLGCGAFALFGIFQAVFLPDFALTVFPDARPYIDFDLPGHRLVSTTLDPNVAAGYLLIFVIVATSFYLHGFRRWLFPGILVLVAFFLTLSRGGTVGLLIGLTFLLTSKTFLYRKAVLAACGIAVIALILYPLLLPQIEWGQRFSINDPSALSRVVEWKFALGVITENPVFGIGFNTFGFLAPRFGFFREGAGAFHLAGDLLVILMMTGVIGFCLYLVMCRQFLMAAKALVQTSSSNWDRALGAGIQAATIGVICSSFFNTLILYPQVMGVLWTLWSLPPALLKPLPVNEMNYQYRSALSPSMIRQEGRIPSFSRASMR